jgi:hypothetical protein
VWLTATGWLTRATACSTNGGEPDRERQGDRFSLIASFPRNEPFAAAGAPQRLPLLIAAPDGAPLDRIDGPVVFTVATADGEPIGDPIRVAPRAEGLARAYLPLVVTFPEPGIYSITGTYRQSELRAAVQAHDPAEVTLPQVGSAFGTPSTPTVADPQGVSPLCTADPPCPLHQTNLATLDRTGPIALLVSTPRYCATAICGPVLEFLVEAASERPDLIAVHAEVYANPESVPSVTMARPSPVVEALSLTYEPALFVVDTRGTLVARLDTIFDRSELREVLAQL